MDVRKNRVVFDKNPSRHDTFGVWLMRSTEQQHENASTAPLMMQIKKGRITRESYAAYIANLYLVYEALETAFESHKTHPVFGALHFPDELSRKQGLADDLRFFYGKEWKLKLVPTKATEIYTSRIYNASQTNPALLVSHSYVRYLGDLFGGQTMKYKIRRCLQLSNDDDGTSFYEFPSLGNVKEFIAYYFARLNAMDVDDNAKEVIKSEIKHAYNLNISMFADIHALGNGRSDWYKAPYQNDIQERTGAYGRTMLLARASFDRLHGVKIDFIKRYFLYFAVGVAVFCLFTFVILK